MEFGSRFLKSMNILNSIFRQLFYHHGNWNANEQSSKFVILIVSTRPFSIGFNCSQGPENLAYPYSPVEHEAIGQEQAEAHQAKHKGPHEKTVLSARDSHKDAD